VLVKALQSIPVSVNKNSGYGLGSVDSPYGLAAGANVLRLQAA
jgi:hypothetical protein